MEKLLIWLSGKKGVIASIILTIVGYLGAQQVISSDLVALIGSLVAIIFGAASYKTYQIYNK